VVFRSNSADALQAAQAARDPCLSSPHRSVKIG
jgi:hypothetical protein